MNSNMLIDDVDLLTQIQINNIEKEKKLLDNTCGLKVIESKINVVSIETGYGFLDHSTWVKPLMKKMCDSKWIEDGNTDVVFNIWDYYPVKQWIPNRPVVQLHLLPASEEKILHFASFENQTENFKIKFSFKLEHSHSHPFLAVLKIESTHSHAFSPVMVLNNKKIKLKRYEDCFFYPTTFCKYWMGNEESEKYYSYLPTFNKLFVDEHGLPCLSKIQFIYNKKMLYCIGDKKK